ncbi:helix-turn-helix domain-containing protein [Phytohabitans sp. ZYX-F-186]|uniref:Helix-turn-helix domain-containing protein n=1 Tax=Phytohabitans maris TaxID=3071409 RepID=A0ABU0ZGY3_9ACTN|nr:helix-turn-helix domain-containing protein [Phytohabitans sp. ZYX-F-186]MDQ7906311.1 helix-turn-helix domain-containing protein [Phytohabitans sp. ZYX-F-186]
MTSQERRSAIRLDSRQLRVLAHPLRSRLLTALRLDGPATATRLAAAMGTNTGATSYHLRQLAAVGLVVEEAGQGHGRERWWRAAHHEHGWRSRDVVDDPDDRAAAMWLSEHQVRLFAELLASWVRDHYSHPPDWRDAAEVSDFGLRLPPDRLRALNDELHAVVDRYQREATGDGDQVLVFFAGFPRLAPDGPG